MRRFDAAGSSLEIRGIIPAFSQKPILKKEIGLITLRNTRISSLDAKKVISIQARYQQNPVAARIESWDDESIEIVVLEDIDFPAVGQSCVVYDGDIVLAGGIIDSVRA